MFRRFPCGGDTNRGSISRELSRKFANDGLDIRIKLQCEEACQARVVLGNFTLLYAEPQREQ